MEDPLLSLGEGCRVLVSVDSLSGCLATDELDLLVVDEVVECTDGVASSTDACDAVVGEPSLGFRDLLPDLLTDDRLELTDHVREGVGSDRGTDEVVGVADALGPLPEGLVYGVLEDTST